MLTDKKIDYWLKSAEKDKQTADLLFKHGHYDWSLFIWHLVLEKLLKAILLSQGKPVILTHNLTALYQSADLELSDEERNQLTEIRTFNIEARYDNYKLDFYKKATKKYAQHWTTVCEALYLKFKEMI